MKTVEDAWSCLLAAILLALFCSITIVATGFFLWAIFSLVALVL